MVALSENLCKRKKTSRGTLPLGMSRSLLSEHLSDYASELKNVIQGWLILNEYTSNI
jgi:hypothetical protein